MRILQQSTILVLLCSIGNATSRFIGGRTEEEEGTFCDDASGLCSVNPRLNPSQLLQDFPNMLDDDLPEESEILCPMLRMMRRTGVLPKSIRDPHYSISSIVEAMTDNFGLSLRTRAVVTGVATGMSMGQLVTFSTYPGFVNLDQLYNVFIGSHGSGYSFDGGSTAVSQNITSETISALKQLEDSEGHLSFDDLKIVKEDAASSRGISVSPISMFEAGFIWTFCGGEGRGYVETTDVELFLDGRMPLTVGQPGLRWWIPE